MATTAPPFDPGFDLYANQQGRIRASNVVFIILPTIFVILRLISRKISRVGYWWDDLLIVFALLLSYALPIINIESLSKGFGRHIYLLPLDTTRIFLKSLWVFEIFWGLATCCNKLSILAFYRRIFPIAQLRVVLMIMTALILCFNLTFMLVVILQCVPVHAFWDLQYRLTATCLNANLVILIFGGINCALDAIIVFMPIPLLWRLRTTKGQKLTLTSIFCVAGFVCLCSIIRLVVLSRLETIDLTWNYINASIWTATEPSMGVVSACLPSLRPLFKRLVSNTYRGPTFKGSQTKNAQDYGSNISSRYIWSHKKGASVDLNSRSFSHLDDMGNEPNSNWGFNVHVHGGKDKRVGYEDQIDLEGMQTPERRIKVKTEVTLISTERMEYRDQLF